MAKHLTSSEDGGFDIAKRFEKNPKETAGEMAGADAAQLAWQSLLGSALEREILPVLLKTLRDSAVGQAPIGSGRIDDEAVAAFVALIIDDDIERLRAVSDRVILHTGGRNTLLNDLLTPAARLLGRMWEEDTCDFMTVTLGVYRLNQIMRETESACMEAPLAHGDHRILLLPAPGEQHSFGVTMVADAFRGCGWCVRSAPSASRKQLLRLVRDEWFDVVGLSVSTERCLKGLAACIRAVRTASCNPRSLIMLGGNAVSCNFERSRFLGADGVAEDAGKAVQMANNYMENTVTERFGQFNTKLSDVSLAL